MTKMESIHLSFRSFSLLNSTVVYKEMSSKILQNKKSFLSPQHSKKRCILPHVQGEQIVFTALFIIIFHSYLLADCFADFV